MAIFRGGGAPWIRQSAVCYVIVVFPDHTHLFLLHFGCVLMDLLGEIVKCLGMRLSNQTSRVTFAWAREIEDLTWVLMFYWSY